VVEGYFSPRSDRTHLVRIEQDRSLLVIVDRLQNETDEVEVPRAHAEALMDVAAGRLAFDRISLPLGDGEYAAILDRFVFPAHLDVISVLMETGAEGGLAWFGPEVTRRSEFSAEALALRLEPVLEDVSPTNAGLDALLDLLDGRLRLTPPTSRTSMSPTRPKLRSRSSPCRW
jgi:hypothetical protein